MRRVRRRTNRRAPPLSADELADRACAEVAVHLGSAARCASSLVAGLGDIGDSPRASQLDGGEFSTARGASGTVMRHFVHTRVFAAPAPVAALALGVTVPAASRVLISAPRRAQRFTPGEAAARAPQYCWPRSQREQMSTWRRHRAHRNSRASSIAPPGGEGWTIRDYRAILHSEPYASADLGAASDVDRQVVTVRGCAGLFAESDLTPTPEWRHLIGGTNSPLVGNIGLSARMRGRARPTARGVRTIQRAFDRSSTSTSTSMSTIYPHFSVAANMRSYMTTMLAIPRFTASGSRSIFRHRSRSRPRDAPQERVLVRPRTVEVSADAGICRK